MSSLLSCDLSPSKIAFSEASPGEREHGGKWSGSVHLLYYYMDTVTCNLHRPPLPIHLQFFSTTTDVRSGDALSRGVKINFAFEPGYTRYTPRNLPLGTRFPSPSSRRTLIEAARTA